MIYKEDVLETRTQPQAQQLKNSDSEQKSLHIR